MYSSPRVILRPATAADESFVLTLEQACLKRQALEILGRWIARPGMGDDFPASCRLIEHEGRDIGCLTVSEECGLVHIDQFYLVPEARGAGIGSGILAELITRAAARSAKLRVSLFSNNPFRRFFENAGFAVVSETTNRIVMERSSSSQKH